LQSAKEAQHLSQQPRPRSAADAGVTSPLDAHHLSNVGGWGDGIELSKREVLVVVSNLEELEDHWQV